MKKFLKKNKGITIISLVMTILILLVVSAIAIVAISGENGVVGRAKIAKLETKRSQIKNILNEELTYKETTHAGQSARAIIEATRLGIINNPKEIEQLGRIEEITEVEEDMEKVYFFVVVDGDAYELNIEGSEFIGVHKEDIEIDDIVGIGGIKPDIEFIYNPGTDTNENVTIELRDNLNLEGYELQYCTEKEEVTKWTKYTEEIEVEKNQTVYARLAKVPSILGKTTVATGTVLNIDKLQPEDFTEETLSATSTTSSITVTANVADQEATDDYKSTGIAGYRFSKDNGETWETNAEGTITKNRDTYQTSGTYIFNDLTQTTNYGVVVEAVDNVGNTKRGVIEDGVDTQTVSGTANISFRYKPSTITNQNVIVTVIGNNTENKVQYKTEKTGASGSSEVNDWTDYPESGITITRNQEVYARVVDSAGQSSGDYATGTVSNIDKEKPTIGNLVGSTTTSNVGTVTATNVTDAGIGGLKGYYINTTGTAPTATGVTWTTLSGNSFTWNTQINGNGKYYAWVIDKAGNISNRKECTVSGLVAKVSNVTYSNITIVAGNTGTPALKYSGTAKAKSYASLNTGIATINASTGVVTGVSPGTATMRVTLTNYDGTRTTKDCTVTVQKAVAKVGNTYYASIANAMNAISSSGTITMVNNTTESPSFPKGKTITLAMNGKTITGNIVNNGTLTINGSGTLTGSLTNTGTASLATATINNCVNNSGTFTLSSGMITGSGWTVNNTGTFRMTGGTIKNTVTGSGCGVMTKGTFTSTGGTITAACHTFVCRGGTSNIKGTNLVQTSGDKYCLMADEGGGKIYCEKSNLTCTYIASTGSVESGQVIRLITGDQYGSMPEGRFFSNAGYLMSVAVTPKHNRIYFNLIDSNHRYNKVQFPTWKGNASATWYTANAWGPKVVNGVTLYYTHYQHASLAAGTAKNGTYTTHVYINGAYKDGISYTIP